MLLNLPKRTTGAQVGVPAHPVPDWPIGTRLECFGVS